MSENTIETFEVGDTVKVVPRFTDFDGPIWTNRETGKVTALGRSRVTVDLGGHAYRFRPRDLQILCTCSVYWRDPDTGREYDQGGGGLVKMRTHADDCAVHGRKQATGASSG